jgi:hypothetical protein
MKTIKREPKESQRPRGITPEPKISTLSDVTAPKSLIIAICESGPAAKTGVHEDALAAAQKRANKGKRILECGNLFLEHIENVGKEVPEPPGMELRLIEAILDYPATKLASGLASCAIHALALEAISISSPYESVRKEAQEKIKKARGLLDCFI